MSLSVRVYCRHLLLNTFWNVESFYYFVMTMVAIFYLTKSYFCYDDDDEDFGRHLYLVYEFDICL